MKVLLIEDEPEVAERITREVADLSIEFQLARDAESALAIIDTDPVDLAICDLKIPESPLVPQAHIAHGLRAFDHIRARWPGVPVIIFSGFGSLVLTELGDRLSAAPQQDLYGDGPTSQVVHCSKSDLMRLVEGVRAIDAKLKALDDIEVSPDTAREYLAYYDRRLLRIYGRQQQGTLLKVERLAGGRSGAVTVKLACEGTDGPIGGAIVAKLNTHEEAEDERGRYRRYIGGLGATTFTPLMETVLAGAGNRAGLFYSLAQGFDRSLFERLAQSDHDAAQVVDALFTAMSAWREGLKDRAVKLKEVRVSLVRDAHVPELPEEAKRLLENMREDQQVNVRWGTSHGDLHGGNVLVRGDGAPVLIDYGRLGKMTACLDPITLELSAILHPDSEVELGDWPSRAQAERWNDLEVYLGDCPIPEYVVACRRWTDAVIRAEREKEATMLGYALRQLRFPDDVDPDLPAALARGAIRRLEEV